MIGLRVALIDMFKQAFTNRLTFSNHELTHDHVLQTHCSTVTKNAVKQCVF